MTAIDSNNADLAGVSASPSSSSSQPGSAQASELAAGSSQSDTPSPQQAAAVELARQLPVLLQRDQRLLERGRWFTANWVLGVGTTEFCVEQQRGSITVFSDAPRLMHSHRFSIKAGCEPWLWFWEPIPEPGHHDILALHKHGLLQINGDLPLLMANLQFIKDLLALPRLLRESAGS